MITIALAVAAAAGIPVALLVWVIAVAAGANLSPVVGAIIAFGPVLAFAAWDQRRQQNERGKRS